MSLKEVIIPRSVKKIASNAFLDTSDDLLIVGEEGSVADEYSHSQGIGFSYL